MFITINPFPEVDSDRFVLIFKKSPWVCFILTGAEVAGAALPVHRPLREAI